MGIRPIVEKTNVGVKFIVVFPKKTKVDHFGF
jgi:hypothetical protein